jgi:flagellin
MGAHGERSVFGNKEDCVMGFRIKTNVSSQVAQNKLQMSKASLDSSLEKLSTGQRINKSADDAAGLAISENMRAKLKSLDVAKRNANDGISYLQTAEGGLNNMNNIAVRMRELVTQASSDTLGEGERDLLDKEFKELGSELVRLKDSAEYNGQKIFDAEGKEDGLSIQIGASFRGEGAQISAESDTIKIKLDKVAELGESLNSMKELSVAGQSGAELGGTSTEEVFKIVDDTLNSISTVRAGLGAQQNRMTHAISQIDVTTENLSAAQSRIRDVDFAEETAKLTQSKILTQAGTSVLGQANSSGESALQLLR